ncbi:MAG: hypothetical protein M5U15_00095 [Kiritimatiellae bacterium]|nr:hypothetical protein [Kiritimatiellia bacterium]
MRTITDIAKALGRSVMELQGLQARFHLPVPKGANYSDAYLECLRKLIYLRTLRVGEDTLSGLWVVEKKILQLLHVDSMGSATWFLDSCAETTHRKRRLLLTNYDMEFDLSDENIQLGLNFAPGSDELFSQKEMGGDVLRLLREFKDRRRSIARTVKKESGVLRGAVNWSVILTREL